MLVGVVGVRHGMGWAIGLVLIVVGLVCKCERASGDLDYEC